MASRSGVKTFGRQRLLRELTERIRAAGIMYIAQFGIKGETHIYIPKRGQKRSEKWAQDAINAGHTNQGWDSRTIFVYHSKRGRNPIFFHATEKRKILRVWQRAAKQFERTKTGMVDATLTVAKMMMSFFQYHMAENRTYRGKGAEPKAQYYRANNILQASKGNPNYERGGLIDRARASGYLVRTGELFKDMSVGAKTITKGRVR